ncbi:MAG: phage holin family protein [Chloroflexi bacterium]|nr:phage holin family protein [Chloroflexota bacterium]
MRHIILRLVINAIGLYAATRFVPGISFEGDWTTIALVAFIFGLVNALVRPVLTVLTCPFVALTLGLFIFVINALMLGLTAWLAGQFGIAFTVADFTAAFLGALVISIVSFLLSLLIRGDDRDRRR